ncbi:MAG: TolC family protein [Gemmatimonadota bacterium]|nr:TolC family protein [Gemmatimonadota bacterium]
MRMSTWGFILSLCMVASTPSVARAAGEGGTGVAPAHHALQRFVQTVVDASPRVKAARAALEARRSDRDAASRPLYNPQINADYERTHETRFRVGIGYTIDWGGKGRARGALAESERRVAEAAVTLVRRGVAIDLLNGLAAHRTGVERDSLAARRQALMHDFAELARRRFETGDVSQVELDLARLASVEARIERATAAASLAGAKQAVRVFTPDQPASQWPSLPSSLPDTPDDADVQSLIGALPEVLAARRRVDAAGALVELRRRERRPDPTLSVGGGSEAGERLTIAEFSMPLPLLNRFGDEVDAAAAEHRAARQALEDVARRARARLISATERYRLARTAWEDWRKTGHASLERRQEQLRRLWKAGDIGTTDYLVHAGQTLDLRESALVLRETLWGAWLEWLSASGQVDAWIGFAADR